MTHEEVFPQLVEAHHAALYRFALSPAKSPADASDLTPQTLLEQRADTDKVIEFAPLPPVYEQ